LESLKSRNTDDLRLLKTLAEVYTQVGNHGKSSQIMIEMAQVLENENEYVQAHAIYWSAIANDLKQLPGDCANPRLNIYARRLQKLNPGMAVNAIINDKKSFPPELESTPAYHILTGLMYKIRQKFTETEEQFLKAAELSTEDNGSGYHVLGKYYKDRKLYDKAAAAFEESIRREGDVVKHYNVSSRIWLGDILLQSGDIDRATELYSWARTKKPELGWARRALANAYIEKNQYLKAINELENFLEKFPEEKEGYFLLGRAYFHLGMIQKARMAFEKCVTYFPEHKYAHRNLMMIYSTLGDKEKANREKQIFKELEIPIE
jgi:tetratricopeptide (TPR) repeat protein